MATTHQHTTESTIGRARFTTILVRMLSLSSLLAGASPTVVTASETAPTSPITSLAPPSPDRTADYVGGAAALLRTSDGADVPGTLFVLMAHRGSQAHARVYDETPYERADRATHPVSIESNRQAVQLVEEITERTVEMVDFTSPPGGGLSTGLTYTIAYLDVLSNGAFTGDLRVASTGELQSDGYISPISAIDEKAAAAHLAGVDVFFTPSMPSGDSRAAYAGRVEGEVSRSRNTGATLEDERRWDEYEAWGAGQMVGGMDVIGVRHVGDVAAYLCGAGSDEACRIRSILGDVVVDNSTKRRSPVADDGVGADVR